MFFDVVVVSLNGHESPRRRSVLGEYATSIARQSIANALGVVEVRLEGTQEVAATFQIHGGWSVKDGYTISTRPGFDGDVEILKVA